MTELRTYVSGGINWNWYLQAKVNDQDKTAEILFHDRFHKFDQPKHPKVTDRHSTFALMEDAKREAYGLRIDQWVDGKLVVTEYLLTNPGNIYTGWNDRSQLELE